MAHVGILLPTPAVTQSALAVTVSVSKATRTTDREKIMQEVN